MSQEDVNRAIKLVAAFVVATGESVPRLVSKEQMGKVKASLPPGREGERMVEEQRVLYPQWSKSG